MTLHPQFTPKGDSGVEEVIIDPPARSEEVKNVVSRPWASSLGFLSLQDGECPVWVAGALSLPHYHVVLALRLLWLVGGRIVPPQHTFRLE